MEFFPVVIDINESVAIFTTAIPLISGLLTTLYRVSQLVSSVEELAKDFKQLAMSHVAERTEVVQRLAKLEAMASNKRDHA